MGGWSDLISMYMFDVLCFVLIRAGQISWLIWFLWVCGVLLWVACGLGWASWVWRCLLVVSFRVWLRFGIVIGLLVWMWLVCCVGLHVPDLWFSFVVRLKFRCLVCLKWGLWCYGSGGFIILYGFAWIVFGFGFWIMY